MLLFTGFLKNTMEMFAAKFEHKAQLKEQELELRQAELEFQKRKWEVEEAERKQRLLLDAEECFAFIKMILKNQKA